MNENWPVSFLDENMVFAKTMRFANAASNAKAALKLDFSQGQIYTIFNHVGGDTSVSANCVPFGTW